MSHQQQREAGQPSRPQDDTRGGTTPAKPRPDFWGREGAGGEEWSVVDEQSEHDPAKDDELGGQSFERPPADGTGAVRKNAEKK